MNSEANALDNLFLETRNFMTMSISHYAQRRFLTYLSLGECSLGTTCMGKAGSQVHITISERIYCPNGHVFNSYNIIINIYVCV